MRSRCLKHRIVYDRREDAARQAWQLALSLKDGSLGLDDRFYEDDLEQVVLAQGVRTRDDYHTARRTGRGVVLRRAKCDAIWPVFEEYRTQLAVRKLKEVDDAYADVAELIHTEREDQANGGGSTKALNTYSAMVIDETQDFGPIHPAIKY